MESVASSDADAGAAPSVEPLSESTVARIPHILPHERVFPIQIGSELFKLSGASLSSDGAYFCFRDGAGCQWEPAGPPGLSASLYDMRQAADMF